MFQRRIIIGAIIGIFVTALVSAVDRTTWRFFDVQFIEGRSFFNIFSPFSKLKKDILVLKLDKKTGLYLRKNNLVEDLDEAAVLNTNLGQALVVEMLKNLDGAKARAVGVLLNLDNFRIQELEIETNIEGILTPVVFGHEENLRHHKINGKTYKIKAKQGFAYELFGRISTDEVPETKQKRLWMNTSRVKYETRSLVELVSGNISNQDIEGKIVIFADENNQKVLKTELTALSNYLTGKWLEFFKFPGFLFLLLMMGFGVFMVLVKTQIRLIASLAFVAAYCLLAQLLYMAAGLNLETSPLLFGIALIVLVSHLIDFNLETFSLKEKIKFISNPNQEETRLEQPKELQAKNLIKSLYTNVTKAKIDEAKLKDLSYYTELEENLEAYALELQEKTVKSVMDLQTRIDRMLLSGLIDQDTTNELHLVNYDFNKTMDDLDNILFDMVPFQLEKGNGIMDPIRHLADKVLYKSKGAMRATLSADIEQLDLSRNTKVNTYRILQKLIDIVIEKSRGTNIAIEMGLRGNKLKFAITYDGININPGSANSPAGYRDYRFRDIYRRLELLDAEINFVNELTTISDLTNKIRLDITVEDTPAVKAAENILSESKT